MSTEYNEGFEAGKKEGFEAGKKEALKPGAVEAEYPEYVQVSGGGTLIADSSLVPMFYPLRVGTWEHPLAHELEKGKKYTLKLMFVPID